MRVFIGLGSNLGDGPLAIRDALDLLDEHDSIQIVRISSLYRTSAWGYTDQADFTNAVAEIETSLCPAALLTVLLDTELIMGRERNSLHWGPRAIDIDLLCCGELILGGGTDLVVPHPRMHLRAFVLVPLLELAPDLVIPGIGPAQVCLDRTVNQTVIRLE